MATYSKKNRYLILALAASVATCLHYNVVPAHAADPTPQATEQAKAWTSFYVGAFKSAADSSAKLLALPASSNPDKWEAAHCQARSLWALGDAASRNQAQKLWNELGKITSPSPKVKTRITIAQVTVLSPLTPTPDPAKLAQSITLLENAVAADSAGTATAEAAIELGLRYTAAKKFDDAQRQLEFVERYLAANNLTRLETADAAAAPFRKAAQDALRQLEFAKNVGMEDFAKAEALRKADKFTEAVAAYQAILKNHAQTDYAPRADLALGQCYVGLNRPLQAVEHWKRFVGAAPAGPWRGQAYAAMIDLQLENLLDLPAAATYADMAINSLKTALADEKIAPSWQPLLFDIHLRIGTVRLLQQNSSEAVVAFEQAKRSTHYKQLIDSIDPLIAAAKSDQSLLPSDVQDASPASIGVPKTRLENQKATMALSLAMIATVSRRFDAADAIFDRVLTDRLLKRTPAQEGFATFGKALVLLSKDKSDPAQTKDALIAAIKAHPQGTWQDETLYQLAVFIQEQAEGTFKREDYTAKHNAPNRPNDAERKQQQKAQDERQAKRIKANSEALPYWQELIKRYPKSPRAEQAWYMAGVLQLDMENWKDGLAHFDKFVEAYPNSPYAGEALLILGQNALERRVDLSASQAYLKRLDAWITDTRKKTNVVQNVAQVWQPTFSKPATPNSQPQAQSRPSGEGQQRVRLSGSAPVSERRYTADELIQCYSDNQYLASIEIQCAQFLGFTFFVQGDKENAATQYARMRALDTEGQKTEAAGEWSDYSRLKWGLDNGYFFAKPTELALYKDRQHLAVQRVANRG